MCSWDAKSYPLAAGALHGHLMDQLASMLPRGSQSAVNNIGTIGYLPRIIVPQQVVRKWSVEV